MGDTEKRLRSLIDRANRQDVDGLQDYLAENLVFINPVTGRTNKDGMRAFHAALFGAFPDTHYHIDHLLVVGNSVVVECTVTGTQKGDFAGVAASNRRLELPVAFSIEFSGDLVEEWRTYLDTGSLIRQLTAEPASAV